MLIQLYFEKIQYNLFNYVFIFLFLCNSKIMIYEIFFHFLYTILNNMIF